MNYVNLEELGRIVLAELGPDASVDWWVTPNPLLEDLTPGEMAAQNPERLEVYIRGAWGADQPLITLQPDESENWKCLRCKALTSTMLTRCYQCDTPRPDRNSSAAL